MAEYLLSEETPALITTVFLQEILLSETLKIWQTYHKKKIKLSEKITFIYPGLTSLFKSEMNANISGPL